jgi:hypothetical protein
MGSQRHSAVYAGEERSIRFETGVGFKACVPRHRVYSRE